MINSVELSNFRNLDVLVELQRQSLIIKPNGYGKSNFLESIFLGITGDSLKTINTSRDLIGEKETPAVIILEMSSISRIVTINEEKPHRKYLVDGVAKSKSNYTNFLNAVVFQPQDLDFVSGEPSSRRKELDIVCAFFSPEYAGLIKRYKMVLKNRNKLLTQIRDEGVDPSSLKYWDEEFSKLAFLIIRVRIELINKVNTEIPNIISSSGWEDFSNIEFAYTSKLSEYNAAEIADKLHRERRKEIASGISLYGPHRDDLEIQLEGKNARYFASRGEQRVLTLLWKLSQIELFADNGKETVLLIDDIMSELDDKNREYISQTIIKFPGQVIIASATEKDIPEEIISSFKLIGLGD